MPWTVADIPNQAGRIIVVTGGNSGIGLEAAHMFAAADAEVVIACRNPTKATAALEALQAKAPNATISTITLDLADLASVRACSKELHERYEHIDVLVNNAGVMALPQLATADGFEMQFGTNHLGPFALTSMLVDMLKDVPNSRIVHVSSIAHRTGSMRFDDLHRRNGYQNWLVYGQSKLSNLLFHFELERRLRTAGAETISVACHPGYAATNLVWVAPELTGSKLMALAMSFGERFIAQSGYDGALPTAMASTDPAVVGGDYIGPNGFREMWGPPIKVGSSSAARDIESQGKLWSASVKETGEAFGALQ